MGNEMKYIVGDFNIDCQSKTCPLNKRSKETSLIYNLKQLDKPPTRIMLDNSGCTSSTCIDRIYINDSASCSDAESALVAFTEHNIVAITRKSTT